MAGVKANGTQNDDKIFVDAGNDTINAGNGNDIIYSGAGNDVITGGKGNNTIYLTNPIDFDGSIGFGNDVVNLTSGENLVIECPNYSLIQKAEIVGKDVVLTFNEKESVTLKNFASRDVVGSKGDVSIKLKDNDAFSLKDLVFRAGAFNKNAAYTGSWLSEIIDGSLYANSATKGVNVNAGKGDDAVYGTLNADTIKGGDGNDALVGYMGADKIYGGNGHDYIEVFETNDKNVLLDGGAGNDEMNAGKGNDTLKGGAGNDTLSGFDGADKLYGDAGEDTLYGGLGKDSLYGGDGDDMIVANDFSEDNAGNLLDGGKGNDYLLGSVHDDTFVGGAGDDIIYASAGNDVITGGAGKNSVYFDGAIGNNVVNLTAGENILLNFAEKETFEAKIVGKDVVLTFGDNETVTIKNLATKDVVGSKGSVLVELANPNYDVNDETSMPFVTVDLKESLFASGEIPANGVYSGKWMSEVIDASGVETAYDKKSVKGVNVKAGNGDDEVTGSKFNDTIYGDKGDDYLVGGLGKDSIYGGDGNDEITAGLDTDDDTWGTDTDGNYVDAGKGDDDIYGSDKNDTLKAGDGDDYVLAMEGDDIVYAGNGNDYVWTYGGNDTVYGGNGHDALVAEAGGSSTLYGEKGNDLIEIKYDGDVAYGGDGDDMINVGYGGIDKNVYGETVKATVYGGKGNDVISIHLGGATVNGEAGNDVIWGSRTAASNIVFAAGGGNDVYKHMGQADVLVFDKINASSLSFETVTSSRADKYYSYDEEDRWYENPVKEHTDLVITYGKNQTVTIENYNPETMGNIYVETKDGGKVLLSDMINSYYGTTGANKITTDKEIVYALDGNDKVTITGEGSTVLAGEGNDTVQGGAGQDYILGEAGNDSLLGGAEYDVIDGGAGNDFIDGQEGQSYLMGGAGNDQIIGGSDYDYVEGGEGADLIDGKDGNDYLLGNEGADTIYGGEGNDTIMASTYLYGEIPAGTPTVTDYYSKYLADGSANVIDSGNGDDRIWGSDGADTINAGAGNDKVYAFGEGSVIDLGDGNDLSNLYQNTAKTLHAGAGNDTVSVEYGKATVTGGAGDDSIWGGYVSDSTYKFTAGDGNDLYRYRGYTTSSGTGTPTYCSDTLVFENVSSANMTFAKDGEKLVITYADDSSVALDSYFKEGVDASKWNVYIETTEGKALLSDMEGLQNLLLKLATPEGAIAGTIAGDEISKTSQGETIYGYQGDDTISVVGATSAVYGGEGNDVISIAGANTEVEAGKGDDTINTMRHAASVLTFNKGDGHDVITQINQLPDFVATQKDYLKFTDTTSVLNLTYKQVDNDLVISRNSGADTVTIKDYYAEGVNYKIVLADKSGRETELSKVLATENADFVLGSNADDTINALAGNDTVYALDGDDIINGGDGDDTIYSETNSNATTLGNDYIDGGAGNDLIYCGGGNDTIYGGDGNDNINGYKGDNVIYGGAGNDQLNGGDGNNYFSTGTGNDTVSAGAGNDTVLVGKGFTKIYDKGGDDLVKIADIDTAKVSLRDMAGNDVIEFTATDKDNVNVVFNIDQEGNTDYDGIRIIGDADLEAWKAGNSLTGGISITSDSGVVETIKTADGFQITSTDIDALKADVAGWLTTNNFADVETALTTGSEDQVNALMAVFETANWQPMA